ncbi:MAG: heme ABC transporter permease, partial [Aquabacterium sp.]
SISFKAAPTMASTMLVGMLLTTLGLWAYAIAVALIRLRCIVLEREHDAQWVHQLPEVSYEWERA